MLKRFLAVILSVSCIFGTFALSVNASIKDIATDTNHVSESKSSHDPSELATELLDSISEKAHPYILYTAEEIPTLQEKVTSGLSLKAYERVITTAQSYLGKTINVNASANGILGRQLQAYISYLSTASAISGDTKYAEKAIELAVSAAEKGNSEIYLEINGALAIADFGHAFALAYDCLYEHMNDDQKLLIKNELEEIGTWIYENSNLNDPDSWGSELDRRKGWNWNAVTHGALGLIALSLGDKAEWMTLSIRRMTDYYDLAVDDTGAAMEGLHYLGYGLNSLVPLDAAIYRHTGIELMDDYPELQLMPAWGNLYMTLPQGTLQASVGQGGKLDNYAAPYYIINRYSQSEELWGFYNTYDLWDDNEFDSDYEGNGWNCPAIIFYEDKSLTAVKPTEEEYPIIKEFDKGLVVARDSWESDASMVTFTCGVGLSGCWNHPDDNSFTFAAKGERFVIDLGAGKLTSEEHNVVITDGNGMNFEGGGVMRAGDLQEVKTLANGALYLRGDNINSYWRNNLKDSIRQLVYGGGDQPFVLVYDYVRKDAETHNFTINFYTDPNAEVEIADNERYATITGSVNGEKCYMIPIAEDFVFVETESADGVNRITTLNESTFLRQATLFIMAEPDGSMPEYDYEFGRKNLTVIITRTIDGEKVTETYTLGLDTFIDFTTDQDLSEDTLPEESETTEIETTVEEETTNAIETEETVDTTVESETTEAVETTTESETSEVVETTTESETTEVVETTTETETTEAVETTTETETTEAVETTTETETTEVVETTTETETTEVVETTTETETTVIVETTTELETTTEEETSSEAEQETTFESTTAATVETETETETEHLSDTSDSSSSSGCGSFASLSILPVAAAAASVTILRKKKKD